jgi:hypothetical protein
MEKKGWEPGATETIGGKSEARIKQFQILNFNFAWPRKHERRKARKDHMGFS